MKDEIINSQFGEILNLFSNLGKNPAEVDVTIAVAKVYNVIEKVYDAGFENGEKTKIVKMDLN